MVCAKYVWVRATAKGNGKRDMPLPQWYEDRGVYLSGVTHFCSSYLSYWLSFEHCIFRSSEPRFFFLDMVADMYVVGA